MSNLFKEDYATQLRAVTVAANTSLDESYAVADMETTNLQGIPHPRSYLSPQSIYCREGKEVLVQQIQRVKRCSQ